MISKLMSNEYVKRFANEYINIFGILIVIIDLDGSNLSNYLSLILFTFLGIALFICSDFNKLEVFDAGSKLMITLVITSFITINTSVVSNNVYLFIFVFIFVPLFSLNINIRFDSKNFERIIEVKSFLNVLIFCIFFITTCNEYLYKDFNLYINLLNGILMVSICNFIMEMIKLNRCIDSNVRNGKMRYLGIKNKSNIKKQRSNTI
ncbi:MAG: hypothetical protein E7J25_00845 [Paeniclostridium sordellii]|nr:hypothetical protein [Paeniclostridium sordellii]